jgi:hypothetical protein
MDVVLRILRQNYYSLCNIMRWAMVRGFIKHHLLMAKTLSVGLHLDVVRFIFIML